MKKLMKMKLENLKECIEMLKREEFINKKMMRKKMMMMIMNLKVKITNSN
jgi:hypothetical protein